MKTCIKERPIAFSADMVRALLQGWKTQTSRTRGLERFNGWPDWKIPLKEQCLEDCRKAGVKPWLDRSVLRRRQAMFLPRCASRILLEITDIEVRKLQSITEEEAMAEGIESIFYDEETSSTGWKNYLDPESMCIRARDSFFTLWDRLHDGGEADPWVWMIKFKVLEVKGIIK